MGFQETSNPKIMKKKTRCQRHIFQAETELANLVQCNTVIKYGTIWVKLSGLLLFLHWHFSFVLIGQFL